MAVFDKTGTLTEGRFGVSDVVLLAGGEENAEVALAAAAESRSEHPIARAIARLAADRKLAVPMPSDVQNLTGEGIAASVDGHQVRIVSPGHLARGGRPLTDERLSQLEAEGKTVVVLLRDGEPRALFALSDIVRPESRQAIAELRQLGIEPVMLTGDAAQVAAAVAADLGIMRFFAEVLPAHKADKIRELQADGFAVAMVGDGVNDAPALVQADLGIAVGAGTDVAVESADVVLVRSDPRDVSAILGLSRATYRKMVQNLLWATGYNAVAIPMAAGLTFGTGFLMTPAIAAVFMSASTVIVALNAQLLRFYKGRSL
jgi:Cu2+-exporting ATPase